MSTPNPELPALKMDGSVAWQPGQTVKTPGTRLAWNCLTGWVQAWRTLQRRRVSSIRYQQESNHIRALPPTMIAEETNPDVLYTFLEIMSSRSGARPHKGERGGDRPTTAWLGWERFPTASIAGDKAFAAPCSVRREGNLLKRRLLTFPLFEISPRKIT